MCVPFLTSELSQAFIQIEAISGEVSPPLSPVSPLCPNDSSGTWPNHLQRLPRVHIQSLLDHPGRGLWVPAKKPSATRRREKPTGPPPGTSQNPVCEGSRSSRWSRVKSRTCLSDWELLCWSWSSEDRRVCKTTQIIRSSGNIILIHVKSDQSRVRPQLATRDAQTHSGDVSLSVSGDGAAQVSGVMATPKVVRL